MQTEFILYVADQTRSRDFYQTVLGYKPDLNVPGMTSFRLSEHANLGLMPEAGIHRLLGDEIIHPEKAHGIPRCELYLHVDNIDQWTSRALDAGARMVSPAQDRDWGDRAVYVADPDGHVIAFAQPVTGD